jgi:LacI family transcriptional regulator
VVKRKRAVTIETVASEAGVSKTTVSFVLNNNPTISATTREKVLQVVRELGYQPNVNARNLSSRRSRTVCVLVPELGRLFEDPYFSRAISGVYDELEAADYRFQLRKASYEFATNREFLNLFIRSEIAGMLYIGSTLDDGYLSDLIDTGYPFVFVNSFLPDVNLPYVIADNVQGGYLATKHLIDLGHVRIGHVSGSMNTNSARERIEGYRKALEEAGIKVDESLVISGGYNRIAARDATSRLLQLTPRPTAIFAANDIMALSVMEVVEAAGLNIPRDIAVVGGDNIELSQLTKPPLTSVEQSVFEVAREAVRVLFDLIDGQEPRPRQVMETRLIVRESSGAREGRPSSARQDAAPAEDGAKLKGRA